MNVVEDKGRLFVYDLQSKDTLIRAHKWASNLTITGKVSAGAGVRSARSGATHRGDASPRARGRFRPIATGAAIAGAEARGAIPTSLRSTRPRTTPGAKQRLAAALG